MKGIYPTRPHRGPGGKDCEDLLHDAKEFSRKSQIAGRIGSDCEKPVNFGGENAVSH
jgi:hypothetical protein